MVASIPTMNGGGSHGHVGMITDNAFYYTFLHDRAPVTILMNPGSYQATVDPNTVVHEQQVVEHKAEA